MEWLLTFSDVLTLLITFFVLLISMSSMDTKRLRETSDFFRGALGALEGSKGRSTTQLFTPKGGRPRITPSLTPVASEVVGASEEVDDARDIEALLKQAAEIAKKVGRAREPGSKGEQPLDAAVVELAAGARPVELVRTRDGGHVRLHLGLLFLHGSPRLRPKMRAWLRRLGRQLGGRIDRVTVPARDRGDKAATESPWLLAAWRGAALVRVLRPGDRSVAAAVIQGKNRSYAHLVWSTRTTRGASEDPHGR